MLPQVREMEQRRWLTRHVVSATRLMGSEARSSNDFVHFALHVSDAVPANPDLHATDHASTPTIDASRPDALLERVQGALGARWSAALLMRGCAAREPRRCRVRRGPEWLTVADVALVGGAPAGLPRHLLGPPSWSGALPSRGCEHPSPARVVQMLTRSPGVVLLSPPRSRGSTSRPSCGWTMSSRQRARADLGRVRACHAAARLLLVIFFALCCC